MSAGCAEVQKEKGHGINPVNGLPSGRQHGCEKFS